MTRRHVCDVTRCHVCDMTGWYVWLERRDECVVVDQGRYWLPHWYLCLGVWHDWLGCVWHNSSSCVWHDWLSCVWHDSLICATWIARLTRRGWWRAVLITSLVIVFTCVTWLVVMCVTWLVDMCVTWLVDMCDMTRCYVWHDSLSCVWHDSLMCVWHNWLICVMRMARRMCRGWWRAALCSLVSVCYVYLYAWFSLYWYVRVTRIDSMCDTNGESDASWMMRGRIGYLTGSCVLCAFVWVILSLLETVCDANGLSSCVTHSFHVLWNANEF